LSDRAVFLDRDGTVNEEVGYLGRPGDVRLAPGAAAALIKLRRVGFKLVIVSNQSGVARGFFTEEDVDAVNARLVELLRNEGACVDAIYYCPHLDGCECRKPKMGMIERARSELGVEPRRSYVIGDHKSDMLLAQNAGATGVMVLTGHGADEAEKVADCAPAHIAADIAGAVDWIIEHEGKQSCG